MEEKSLLEVDLPHSLPQKMLMLESWKVVLTLKPVDKILWFYYTKGISLAILTQGYYSGTLPYA